MNLILQHTHTYAKQGNHSNQFVDGMQVLCHARHRVGFLMAEKSWNQPIIGGLGKLVGCLPVKRFVGPQQPLLWGRIEV